MHPDGKYGLANQLPPAPLHHTQAGYHMKTYMSIQNNAKRCPTNIEALKECTLMISSIFDVCFL